MAKKLKKKFFLKRLEIKLYTFIFHSTLYIVHRIFKMLKLKKKHVNKTSN